MLYVSWARFVREIESSLVLKNIPTGIWETPSIDTVRELGHRYHIDQCGTRRLSAIRPLWLPALQSTLDPLYKGYVKPQDYFSFLQNSSLSEALRKLVLESAGVGMLVECERESSDIALPASIESSLDHVGWISAQIVAVPTPRELGIMTEDDVIKASTESLISCFNDTARDIYVHVRYLQTGQIEQKSLLKKTRPVGGIYVGAPIAIRCELGPSKYGWGSDTHIAEFKACFGGRYDITAGAGATTRTFSTTPINASFDGMLHNDVPPNAPTPHMEFMLLGPSKVFYQPPKVGEKVQVCTLAFLPRVYSNSRCAIRSNTMEFGTIRESQWWTAMSLNLWTGARLHQQPSLKSRPKMEEATAVVAMVAYFQTKCWKSSAKATADYGNRGRGT